MRLLIEDEHDAAAWTAARVIADEVRAAVRGRGACALALSGGSAVAPMFTALAREQLPWPQVQLFQVDERVAPDGHQDRNLELFSTFLLPRVAIPDDQVHPMPVTAADLDAAAARYDEVLAGVTGGMLDVVHLGMGPDGHTASLIPGDPVLDVRDRDVATTGEYEGRRRMTLTAPALNRARRIVWLVTGADKAAALQQMRDRAPTVPASLIRQDDAVLVSDAGAARGSQ